MYSCFISFFSFHNEVGGGVLLSWPKFFLFVDILYG